MPTGHYVQNIKYYKKLMPLSWVEPSSFVTSWVMGRATSFKIEPKPPQVQIILSWIWTELGHSEPDQNPLDRATDCELFDNSYFRI